MAGILEDDISSVFSRKKMIQIYDSNFTETCSHESILQQTSNCSCYASVSNRRQAITCTNDHPVHWRIYAALGGYELIRYRWKSLKYRVGTSTSKLFALHEKQ